MRPIWIGVIWASVALATACGDSDSGTGSGAPGGGGQVAAAGAAGQPGGSGGSGTAGSAGSTGGSGGMAGTAGSTQCPPCEAPPKSECTGSGPCGCGPYTCPTSCGTETCTLAQYCEFTPGFGQFADTYACKTLPAACGGEQACDCLTSEPCAFICQTLPEGGIRLECPGPG